MTLIGKANCSARQQQQQQRHPTIGTERGDGQLQSLADALHMPQLSLVPLSASLIRSFSTAYLSVGPRRRDQLQSHSNGDGTKRQDSDGVSCADKDNGGGHSG